MKKFLFAFLFAVATLITFDVRAQYIPGGGGSGGGATTCSGLSDAGYFCAGTDAVNLTGTVASARISGSYTGITGTGTLLAGASGAGFTLNFATSTLSGTIPNVNLLNPATTVNGQTCTLGSTCTVAAAASTLTGTTLATNVVTSSLTSLGTLSALSISGQATSTIATGTAPFIIASTTRVSNLNVASAANADTVTTNANLTGVITSVGNATSIASQTGTGTKFVVDTSPTLVTPVLGVATGTSLALGGATIGSYKINATGDIKISGSMEFGTQSRIAFDTSGLSMNSSGILSWTNGSLVTNTTDTGLSRNAAGIVQFGTTAANASGSWLATNGTISGTLIAGTADATTSTGGALQVTGGASVAKRFWLPAITTSAGTQTAVLCQASTGEVIADSVACLASSESAKNVFGPSALGLKTVLALDTIDYQYKDTGNPNFDEAPNHRMVRSGFSAEKAAEVDRRLVALNADGEVRTVVSESLIAAMWRAIREQQGEIEALKERLR